MFDCSWKKILSLIYYILCLMGFARDFYTGIAILLIFVPLPVLVSAIVNVVRKNRKEELLVIPAWVLALSIGIGIFVFAPDEQTAVEKAEMKNIEYVEALEDAVDAGKIVYVTDSGSKYHEAGCTSLKGKGIEITVGEAIEEGKEACKNCINE